MKVTRSAGIAVVVGAVGMLAGSFAAFGEQPATGGTEAATWTPKKFTFTYTGFTTKYSCEGLASKMKTILLTLGARKEDLVVRETGCAGPLGRPVPFPGVDVRMSVLTPASDGTVQAHWTPVDLRTDRDPVSASGECELMEQVRRRVLPLFSAHGSELDTNCVPHQLSPSGATLRAHVLTPAPKDPAKPSPAS